MHTFYFVFSIRRRVPRVFPLCLFTATPETERQGRSAPLVLLGDFVDGRAGRGSEQFGLGNVAVGIG
jgi:hypothetical protein